MIPAIISFLIYNHEAIGFNLHSCQAIHLARKIRATMTIAIVMPIQARDAQSRRIWLGPKANCAGTQALCRCLATGRQRRHPVRHPPIALSFPLLGMLYLRINQSFHLFALNLHKERLSMRTQNRFIVARFLQIIALVSAFSSFVKSLTCRSEQHG